MIVQVRCLTEHKQPRIVRALGMEARLWGGKGEKTVITASDLGRLVDVEKVSASVRLNVQPKTACTFRDGMRNAECGCMYAVCMHLWV